MFKVGDRVRDIYSGETGTIEELSMIEYKAIGAYVRVEPRGVVFIDSMRLEIVGKEDILSPRTREQLSEFILELETKRNIQLERKVAADKEIASLENLIEKLKNI
ncbi:hypothetical protein vBYenM531-1_23 [Yersinia phage vB_YenM_531]|nr:hypothetical protein vBYenM531-1_23 [Yersinia phage vB_YenM_531]QKN87458.1 hypothetical protein vBYenM281_023 [Yersinia phage vB_YenM_281]